MKSGLVVVNGEVSPNLEIAGLANTHAIVIAVDGGLRHLHAANVTPTVLIGDLDSADPDQISDTVERIQFPAEKDQTDLELALDYAVEQQITNVTLVAAFGGRWDQTLANVFLALQPQYASLNVTLIDAGQRLHILKAGTTKLTSNIGDVISLIPISAEVTNVSIQGVKWPLETVTLTLGSTWSISNEFVKNTVSVSFEEGRLLAVIVES